MDLVRAESKIRRHNPEGDLLFIKGKVKKKYEETATGTSRSRKKLISESYRSRKRYRSPAAETGLAHPVHLVARPPKYRVIGAATIERVITSPFATS